MKVVINSCYGGFSLSPKAVRRYLEIKGKKAYYFTQTHDDIDGEKYTPVDIDSTDEDGGFSFLSCFTVPNPQEILGESPHDYREKYMVDGELDRDAYDKACEEYNKKTNEIYISNYDIERNDPVLVQVVEEMGEESYGSYAELKIVEIPDDVEWHVAEYDGYEHIAENHRTWG